MKSLFVVVGLTVCGCSVVSEPGAKGEPGEQGPQGAPGKPGEAGSRGPMGIPGKDAPERVQWLAEEIRTLAPGEALPAIADCSDGEEGRVVSGGCQWGESSDELVRPFRSRPLDFTGEEGSRGWECLGVNYGAREGSVTAWALCEGDAE